MRQLVNQLTAAELSMKHYGLRERESLPLAVALGHNRHGTLTAHTTHARMPHVFGNGRRLVEGVDLSGNSLGRRGGLAIA